MHTFAECRFPDYNVKFFALVVNREHLYGYSWHEHIPDNFIGKRLPNVLIKSFIRLINRKEYIACKVLYSTIDTSFVVRLYFLLNLLNIVLPDHIAGNKRCIAFLNDTYFVQRGNFAQYHFYVLVVYADTLRVIDVLYLVNEHFLHSVNSFDFKQLLRIYTAFRKGCKFLNFHTFFKALFDVLPYRNCVG